MYYCGVGGTANNCLKSHLSNRKQLINVDGCVSELFYITYERPHSLV